MILKIKNYLRCIILAMVFVLMFSTVAMAAIPNNSIIFGSKGYDLNLLNDAGLANQILADFIANGNEFVYKDFSGNFINANGVAVPVASLPAVTYKDAQNVETSYASGDGVAVTTDNDFYVTDII